MMVWVRRAASGRIVLVDAGFAREKFITQWKPADYVTPAAAVENGLGIKPADVTDIVISHIHWDHADGVTLFPKATVWLQREEFEHHVGDDGAVLDRAIDRDVAGAFHELRRANRIKLVDGDDREILPGIRVYTGGRHTFASQYRRRRARAPGPSSSRRTTPTSTRTSRGSWPSPRRSTRRRTSPRRRACSRWRRGPRSLSPVTIQLSSAGFLS